MNNKLTIRYSRTNDSDHVLLLGTTTHLSGSKWRYNFSRVPTAHIIDSLVRALLNCVFSAITCQCRHRSFPRVFFPASFRNDVFVSNAFHEAFIATSGSLRSRHPERVWRPKRRQYMFVFMGDGYVTCTSQCRLRSLRANPL